MKIAFFIYTDSMYDYTVGFLEKGLSNSIDFLVFNANSLTYDRSVVHCNKGRDIGRMNSLEITEYFKQENIEALILFSFQSVFDRLLKKIAHSLSILTILYDHGLVYGKTPAKGGLKISMNSLKRQWYYRKNILALHLVKNVRSYHQEFDWYLLYSKNNLDFYSQFFKNIRTNHSILGVPMGYSTGDIEKAKGNKMENRVILYFHQPLAKFKFSNIEVSEEVQYIKVLAEVSSQKGYQFCICLHPSCDQSYIEAYNALENVTVVPSSKVLDAVVACDFVLGHWSTALVHSKWFKKDLAIIDYPGLRTEFDHYMGMFAPVAFRLHSYQDFSSFFDRKVGSNLSLNSLEAWDYLVGNIHSSKEHAAELLRVISAVS